MTRRINGLLVISGLVATLLVPGPAAAEAPNDILIVANTSAPDSALSAADARAIFLRQRGSWPGGGKAVPVHARAGTPLRNQFVTRLLEMTPSEEASYWQDQKIRKGLEELPEFGNPLKAVYRLKGSVSYVFRKDYKEGVAKILLVLPQ